MGIHIKQNLKNAKSHRDRQWFFIYKIRIRFFMPRCILIFIPTIAHHIEIFQLAPSATPPSIIITNLGYICIFCVPFFFLDWCIHMNGVCVVNFGWRYLIISHASHDGGFFLAWFSQNRSNKKIASVTLFSISWG